MKITLTLPELRKALVAVLGAAGEAVALGLVPAGASRWVGIAVGIATAAGVYVVPNGTSAPAAPPAAPVPPSA